MSSVFFTSLCLAGGATLAPLPAAEILEMIQTSEIRNEETFNETHPELHTPAPGLSTIEWEPGAMPEAVRSWLEWELPEEVLNELRNNQSRLTQEPLL